MSERSSVEQISSGACSVEVAWSTLSKRGNATGMAQPSKFGIEADRWIASAVPANDLPFAVRRSPFALVGVVALLGGHLVPAFVVGPVAVPPKALPVEPPASSWSLPGSTSTSPPEPEPAPPSISPGATREGRKPACGVTPDPSLDRWVTQASDALVWHGEPPITDRSS